MVSQSLIQHGDDDKYYVYILKNDFLGPVSSKKEDTLNHPLHECIHRSFYENKK